MGNDDHPSYFHAFSVLLHSQTHPNRKLFHIETPNKKGSSSCDYLGVSFCDDFKGCDNQGIYVGLGVWEFGLCLQLFIYLDGPWS